MKKIYSFDKFINEGVKDMMKPRHIDDIRQSFIDKGYSFRHDLVAASFISDVDGVEQILDLMYDFYKTTDSDEIRETIEDDYVACLDVAVVDGNYDTIETYLSYDIPGLGMSHLQTLLDYNYAGAAELVYDILKDSMSDEERKEVEAKIKNMRLNESVRDRITPKSKEEIKKAIDKSLLRYPSLGTFNYDKYGIEFNSNQCDISDNLYGIKDKYGNCWGLQLEFHYPGEGRILLYTYSPTNLPHIYKRFYSYKELEEFLDNIYKK